MRPDLSFAWRRGQGAIIAANFRHVCLFAYILLTVVIVVSLPPIPQDLAYHGFADLRAMLGIPNALNVLSNIPFLVVGLLGVRTVQIAELADNRGAWCAFFLGVALVSGGSAWYHWAPGNSSLVWDRLPMTVGFMGLLVALCREYLPNPLLRHALIPAVLVGVASVFYWQQTDDLRVYLWVQFMPLGLIVLLILFFPPRYTHGYLLGIALALYALAKVAEYYDAFLFQFFGHLVSGHSIKHLLAAAGCYLLLVFLWRRQPKVAAQTAAL